MNLENKLYYVMRRIRSVEEKIAEKYIDGEMRCPTHLSIGQEGVAAAFSLCVSKNDFAVSTHRGHAHYLGKGGNLDKMISELYGKSNGCSKGKGGSMHLIDLDVNFMGTSAIVGNSIPIGVGLGLSIRLKKTDQISVIFFGDGAIEEGVFYESLNFAVLKNLPVLFVCENNLYSVYSNLEVRQPIGREIYKMVSAIGISSDKADGNNSIESYEILKNKIDLIRQGKGPQFIEFFTYRWREHCGPNYDNDIGYRSISEFEEWKKKDPINRLIENISDEEFIKNSNKKINEEIDKAFSYAQTDNFPKAEEAFHGIFADESFE